MKKGEQIRNIYEGLSPADSLQKFWDIHNEPQKNAYFKNIIELGDLFLDNVFIEFEREPILFTCIDTKKNTFLCFCSEIRYEQKWIVLKCDPATLSALVDGKIDIRSAFTAAKTLTVITLDVNKKETSFLVDAETLDPRELPEENVHI